MTHPERAPKLKLVIQYFCVAFCLNACSSTYTVSLAGKPDSEYSYSEMNEELNGQEVKIELWDGRYISAAKVHISEDSVSWLDAGTAEKSNTATQQIRSIVFKNHSVGALEGFVIVAPVVFVGSWGIDGFSDEGMGGSDGWALPAALGLVGGGIGLVTGAIIGHSYNYEFLMIDKNDSLANGK